MRRIRLVSQALSASTRVLRASSRSIRAIMSESFAIGTIMTYMNALLEPGKYIVAVSGGIDSVVLLDLLRRQPDLELIVAHLDHGIRPESAADASFVARLAQQHNFPFYTKRVELGGDASEAQAREARYAFLHAVRLQTGAQAIVTAHHQDDVLETAILNLLRGTGRRGLSSLQTTEFLQRPLLGVSKSTLRQYALKHGLQWREDSTNQDHKYLRNYVRLKLLPQIPPDQQQKFLKHLKMAGATNQAIDELLEQRLSNRPALQELSRSELTRLGHAESRELMAAWLRLNGIRDFDRAGLERLVVAAKVTPAGRQIDVLGQVVMQVGKRTLALRQHER